FLRDSSYGLAADERDGRDIVGAAVVVQQEYLPPRALFQPAAKFRTVNGKLFSTRRGHRHLQFLRVGTFHGSAIAKQLGQLPGSEPRKGAARCRLNERVAPVSRDALQCQHRGDQGLTAHGLDRITPELADYTYRLHYRAPSPFQP